MARQRVGQNDIVGAVVVSVDWNEMALELDGRKFVLELQYDDDYHSMCEGNCCYGSSSGYFIVDEIV